MADGNHPQRRYGSFFADTLAYDRDVRRKTEAWGFLDRVCQEIEPTDTQQGRAKRTYETVGDFLSEDVRLAHALIYAQGSAALGTMVKPIAGNEIDVDLICRAAGYGQDLPPARLKAMVGDRLKADSYYRTILQEMPRCWRLNYAGDFHLDITPSILNPQCANGGELVPDRRLQCYKPSNPIGYRELFARRAALTVRTRVAKAFDSAARADVQSYPTFGSTKGVLRRIVQLLKAHRDRQFQRRDPCLAPLSIIITTLAMRAYECCVQMFEYDNELDLLCDTIHMMPVFIERVMREGEVVFVIANETTKGENFAEKWIGAPERASAFYAWQERALADFEAFRDAAGMDLLQKSLADAIGEEPVRRVTREAVEATSAARRAGRLGVTATTGLGLAGATSTSVRANTFFGRP